jgi:hypothetical protein
MLTLTKFKLFMDITEDRTEKDTLLQEFIADAIGEANRVSNRVLEFSEHTVYLDGTGTNEIDLTEAPVNEITELKYWNGEDYVDLPDSGDTLEDIVRAPLAERAPVRRPGLPSSGRTIAAGAGSARRSRPDRAGEASARPHRVTAACQIRFP